MAYHWSLEDNEEPNPNKLYPEPTPEDKDSVSLKEKKISARKDMSLKFSSMQCSLHWWLATT